MLNAASIPASGTQKVTGHRLCATHQQVVRMVSERTPNGDRLKLVIQWRRCSMRVDVCDFFWFDPRLIDSNSHRLGCAFSFGMGLRHVMGVAGCAVPDEFAQDVGAAFFGVFQRLDDNHTGAFAKHKPVAFPRRTDATRLAGRRCAWRGLCRR